MGTVTAENPRPKAKRVVVNKYTRHACNQCKKAKTKCEGKPVCERCLKTGHDCIWVEDNRKALTRHHEQALRHQNGVLKAEVDALKAELASLYSRVGLQDTQLAGSSTDVKPIISPTHSNPSTSRTAQSPEEIQARSQAAYSDMSDYYESGAEQEDFDVGYRSGEESVGDDGDEDVNESEYDSDSEDVDKLVAPTKKLFIEADDLHLYGLTSVFRLRRSASQRTLRFKRSKRDDSPPRTAKHILLLPNSRNEESKPHCDCQSDCWSRYLPKGISLTRREHDILLDRLFLFFSSWCMRILPEFFLRDMHRALHAPSSVPPPKTAHYSAFLHNSLLSVATAFSDDPQISSMETRQKFADEAKSYIEEECSKPSISAVQALSVLASFYSGQGLQTLGFMYFGMSARISQALGLGADCTQLVAAGRMKSRDLFDRYWCFHMGCAQDACWSLYVGREFGIPLGHNNDPHSLLALADPDLDYMTWRRPDSDGQAQMCRTFTVFVWTCDLMKISRRIMDLMERLSQTHTDGGSEIKILVSDIDILLINWREDLPSELKLTPSNEGSALPHKLMMHLAYWWLLILLHRPFYRRQGVAGVDLTFSINRCNLAAREILNILRCWRKNFGTVRFAPITIIQSAFASGTIYILSAMRASMGRRPATVAHSTALDNVQEIINILREIGQSWQCASRISDIFEKLLGEQRRVMESGQTRKKKDKRRKRASTLTVVGTATPRSSSNSEPFTPSNEETTDMKNVNVQAADTPSFPYFHQGQQQLISPPSTDTEARDPAQLRNSDISDDSELSAAEDGDARMGDSEDEQLKLLYGVGGGYNSDEGGTAMSVLELTGMGFGMIDGASFATQPFMAFGSQPPGAMAMGMGVGGGFGMGYGYNPFYGMAVGGNMGGPSTMHAGASGSQTATGNAGYAYDMDFTSDGEDRVLVNMIASLRNEGHSQQQF